jgi:amino acid adenylation domain-containing protein
MSGASSRSTESQSLGGASAVAEISCDSDQKEFFPLSFSQQQMWYVCQFQAGTVAYNQPVAWRLTGRPNFNALEQSLNAITQRHEALRTTFPTVDGKPVQCVHRNLPLTMKVVDLRSFPVAERQPEAQKIVLDEARYAFDLTRELLLRAALLQTGDEDYIFIVVVHHIVCDGWSMGILIRELVSAYRSFVGGEAISFRESAVQYTDFSLWQRDYLTAEKLESQITYWKEQLLDARAAELPTCRARPPIPAFRGATQTFSLPKDLSSAFKKLCAENGVFLFMGLLAVVQLLIHRYTGEQDIIVGAPIAARKRAKFQNSIGLFLNLIALRTDFSGDPSFRELLKRVCSVVMGAYRHQDLPFERLVEEVRPLRVPGRSPLFQVTLDQVDPKWIALGLEDTTATWFPVDNQTSKFDLTLAWFDSAEGLRGWLEYNCDLFDAAMITRMQGQYRTLIESVIAKPDTPISQIPILTENERQHLLLDWNETQADYPQACIHELFELQAQTTPDAIAIETEQSQITYRDLDRRANQLARYLARLGAGPESRVGVCLERSCELMVALLGIFKAGAAYVPLDPAYPPQRLDFMLKDAGLKMVLTHQGWEQTLPKTDASVICLDHESERLAQESEESPKIPVSPDNLAYVIYTSGSTGQSKGVLALHRGAANRFAWMWNAFPFVAGEIACAKTSLNFVDSIWELFGPLLAGIPTVMIPDDIAKSPQALIAALARHGVTRLVLVPSLLRAMLDSEAQIATRLPLLKYWISSGEALSVDLVRRFRASLPNRILLNLYGSSEVAADVTCYDTANMRPGDPVLVGRPIANTQIYVLDRNLQPTPVGVRGQLCVSGNGLARGYLDRPDQTKFIPHPFHDDKTVRMYLTGDSARCREDGNIELLGRIDDDRQIKIRGFRVEPGEIEAALRQHHFVAQAVVVPTNDPAGGTRLLAYIAHTPNAPDDSVPQLREYLRERLPEHMVPASFAAVPALPLLPNGKIDRQALERVNVTEAAKNPNEFCTATELRIQQVWQEALQLEHVGKHDNFFDVGGHSLLLASVQSKLMSVFNRQIASVDLYQYPTISALARRLDDHEAEQRPLGQVAERARKQKEILSRLRTASAMRPK